MAIAVSILDIAELPPGVVALIPAEVARFLGFLGAVDHQAVVQGSQTVHFGVLQSLQDVGVPLPGSDFPLRVPGLTTDGVPFRLAIPRSATQAPAPPAVEPASYGFVLDLFVENVELRLPEALQPAHEVESIGTARHLVPDASKERVRLITRGVLRIALDQNDDTSVELISAPDPFATTTATGFVFDLQADPPHILLSDSGFGLTLDRLRIDASRTVTPPDLQARGRLDPAWRGLALEEFTLYLPQGMPVLGDVSVGVNDLLVGFDDAGVQGELEVQLGESAQSIVALQFSQQVPDGVVPPVQDVHYNADPGGWSQNRQVTLHPQTRWPATVRAQMAAGLFRWTLPDGTTGDGQDTGFFTVGPTDRLRIQPLPVEDGETVPGLEWTFTFGLGADVGDPDHAPLPPAIRVETDSHGNFDDVVHVQGPEETFGGFRFTAQQPMNGRALTDAELDALVWTINDASDAFFVGRSAGPLAMSGVHTLTLHGPHGTTRRLLFERRPAGEPTLLGHHGDVSWVPSGARPTRPIVHQGTLDLAAFHGGQSRLSRATPVTIAPDTITVPDNALARLELAQPDTILAARQLRLMFGFDTPSPAANRPESFLGHRCVYPTPAGDPDRIDDDEPLGAGPADHTEAEAADSVTPAGRYTHAPYTPSAVRQPLLAAREWANQFPAGTRFVVVGRTCDMARGTDTQRATYNRGLARRRAASAANVLVQAGIAADRIHARGEQDTGWLSDTDRSELTDLPAGLSTDATPATLDSHLSGSHDTHGLDPFTATQFTADAAGIRAVLGADRNQPHPWRREYRRADILALVPQGADLSTATHCVQRIPVAEKRVTYVPGVLRRQAPVAPPEPHTGWRLVLRVRWDSPTCDDGAWVPTLAEGRLDFQVDALDVPEVPGDDSLPAPTPRVPGHNEAQFWSLIARWAWDPRTGRTLMSLVWDGEGHREGLLTEDSPIWVGIAGLGPAVLGNISPADPGGSLVRIGALAAGAAFLGQFVTDGRLTLRRLELAVVRHASTQAGAGSGVRLVCDYEVLLSFGGDPDTELPLGLRTDQPLRIRYKDVGLRWTDDDALPWYERLSFDYSLTALEVVDPGAWQLEGGLGELVGVRDVRVGAGSVWVELDLELGADLGVVEVSGAVVRLTFDDDGPSFELRGLKATVDVPGVVRGQGQLLVADGGRIEASIDCTVDPLQLQVEAALKLDPQPDFTMVDVGMGVRFAAGIPLLGTGAAIFGFDGRFVMHGERDLSANANLSRPEREFDWVRRDQPYKARHEGVGLGLGVVVGTLPDQGFTLSARGGLAVQVPDLAVSLTVDGTLLTLPSDDLASVGNDLGAGLSILGIVTVDSEGVFVGLKGTLDVKRLLLLEIPVQASFPFTNPAASFLYVGTDGVGDRTGGPVRMSVLPGLLDLDATAYFMVKGDGIENLGDAGIDLRGFSIGFGAEWARDWRAGPFVFDFGARFIAGVGTRPLFVAGRVELWGDLDLVLVGVGASADLELGLGEDIFYLKGRVCGRVKLLWWTIKGCVGFTLGQDASDDTRLPPPPLVEDVVLVDRRGRLVTDEHGGMPVGWVDAVPVVRFAHPMAIRGDLPTSDFIIPELGAASQWVGSRTEKHAYRLDRIELRRRQSIGPGTPSNATMQMTSTPLDVRPRATWLHRHHTDPSAESVLPRGDANDGFQLLLTYADANALTRNLANGGDGLPGSPGAWLESLCEPPPKPTRACAFGSDALEDARQHVRIPSRPVQGPYPSRFDVHSGNATHTDPQLLDAIVGMLGAEYIGPVPHTLEHPLQLAGHAPIEQVLELPKVVLHSVLPVTLPYSATYTPAVHDPDLALVLVVDIPEPYREDPDLLCLDFRNRDHGENKGIQFAEAGVTFHAGRDWRIRDRDNNGLTSLELHFDGGFRLPDQCLEVTLRLATFDAKPPQGLLVRGINSAGTTVVASVDVGDTNGQYVEVQLQATDIRAVTLTGAPSVNIERICYRLEASPLQRMAKQIQAAFTQKLDGLLDTLVEGQRGGQWTPWPGRVLNVFVDAERLRVEAHVQHHAPAGGAAWTDFRIHTELLPYFTIGLGATCGVSQDAMDAYNRERLRRKQERQRLEDLAAEAAAAAAAAQTDDSGQIPAGTLEPAEPSGFHVLFSPDTEYFLRVHYTRVSWYASDHPDQSEPGVPDFEVDGVKEHTDAGFRTGPLDRRVDGWLDAQRDERALPDLGAVNLYGTRSFDPRALTRFIIDLWPGEGAVAFYRSDDLGVHFRAGHIDRMLRRYGLQLRADIRRTDPPPGDLQGLDHPVRLALETRFGGLVPGLWDPVDQLSMDAAQCVEPPIPGGSGWVRAPLEPRAAYDFALVVVRADAEDAFGLAIERRHFTTSSHHDARQFFRSMGYRTFLNAEPAVEGAVPPQDLFVDGVVPVDEVHGEDDALQAVLDGLELFALPVPLASCTRLLWRRDGADLILAAVLLDADEPLRRPPILGLEHRGPRTDVLGGRIVYRGAAERNGPALRPIRSNASGTRVLFRVEAPVAPHAHETVSLELEVADAVLGTFHARRRMSAGPALVSQEVVR